MKKQTHRPPPAGSVEYQSRLHKVELATAQALNLAIEGNRSSAVSRLHALAGEVADHPDACLCLAYTLHALGQHDAALDLVKQVERLGADSPTVLEWFGRIHWQAGRFDAALSAFETLSKRQPASATTLLAQVLLKIELGRNLEGPLHLLHEATRVEPDDPFIWYALSKALHQAGRPQESWLAFERSCQLLGDQPFSPHLDGSMDDWSELYQASLAALIQLQGKVSAGFPAGVQSASERRSVIIYGRDGQPAMLGFVARDQSSADELETVRASLMDQSVESDIKAPGDNGNYWLLSVRFRRLREFAPEQIAIMERHLREQAEHYGCGGAEGEGPTLRFYPPSNGPDDRPRD